MQEPRVAVILCTYNTKKYLSEDLESVLAQRYPNFEVIVVDDGSTDGTDILIKEKYLNEINYIYQPNRGLSAARNTSINAAGKVDYFSIVDADDIMHPLKLREEIAFLEHFKEAVLCFSNMATFKDGLEESNVVWNGKGLLGDERTYGIIENPIEKISRLKAFTSVSTIRAQAIRDVGGYDEKLKCAMDLDITVRLSRIGSIGFINRIRYLHRKYPQTLTSAMDDRIVYLNRIFDKIRKDRTCFDIKELVYLSEMERIFLLKSLWGTAIKTVKPGLKGDIIRRLLRHVKFQDFAIIGAVECLRWSGLANTVHRWRTVPSNQTNATEPKIRIKDALGDLTLCFDRISPIV